MRTSKFRGKGIETKDWWEGSLIQLENGKCYITQDILTPQERGEKIGYCLSHFEEVIPSTIGQSTGLYDKNGVEIWEGDIVKLSDGYSLVMPIAYKGEITFDKAGYLKCGRTPLHEMPIEYYEVIGNTHEDKL
jgi:uncharacterized phage protein (TIGR01671 family)